jgi:hypothetical protein
MGQGSKCEPSSSERKQMLESRERSTSDQLLSGVGLEGMTQRQPLIILNAGTIWNRWATAYLNTDLLIFSRFLFKICTFSNLVLWSCARKSGTTSGKGLETNRTSLRGKMSIQVVVPWRKAETGFSAKDQCFSVAKAVFQIGPIKFLETFGSKSTSKPHRAINVGYFLSLLDTREHGQILDGLPWKETTLASHRVWLRIKSYQFTRKKVRVDKPKKV